MVNNERANTLSSAQAAQGDGRTRTRILMAAIDLFAERGFESTTMRDLASAVGVKAPAIYNHFSSKEDILAESVEWAIADFMSFVLDEDDDSAHEEERLRGLLRRHVLYQLEHRTLANANDLLMQADAFTRFLPDSSRERVRVEMRNYLDLVCKLIAKLVRGDVRVTQSLRVTALALLTMCDRVSFWYRPEGQWTPQQIAEHFCVLADHIVAAERAAHSGGRKPSR